MDDKENVSEMAEIDVEPDVVDKTIGLVKQASVHIFITLYAIQHVRIAHLVRASPHLLRYHELYLERRSDDVNLVLEINKRPPQWVWPFL